MTERHDPRPTSSGLRTIWMGLALLACFAGGIGVGAFLWRDGQGLEQAMLDTDRQARIVSNGYKAADLLLVAADNFAKERGLTYTALRGHGQITDLSRGEIMAARMEGEKALAQVLTLMKGHLGFSSELAIVQHVSEYIEAVERMRVGIDGRKGTEDPTSSSILADKWFERSSRLLSSTEQLLELVHVNIRSVGVDTNSEVALKLQRFAIIMTDLAGRERGAVSGALAENKVLDESFALWALPAYRARIDGIWASINTIANANALTPEITASIMKIEQDYFGELAALREDIKKASDAGESYSITAENWFSKSSIVIASMVDLGRQVGNLMLTRFENSQRAS